MASLADILKAKKAEQQEASIRATQEEPISYLYKGHAAVGEAEFLACYTLLICNPYDCPIMDFREYREFILDDRQYILNTFYRLNITKLLRLYMVHHPIQEPKHLHSLSMTLHELDLCVPGFFQDRIERLIILSSKRKNFLIDKLPDFG